MPSEKDPFKLTLSQFKKIFPKTLFAPYVTQLEEIKLRSKDEQKKSPNSERQLPISLILNSASRKSHKNKLGNGWSLYDVRAFIGRPNQSTALHFDWNLCPNYLINLEGTKSAMLFSPTKSHLLQGYANFSPAQLTTKLKKEAKHFELGPREVLFLPPLWWHKIFYKTKASSLSFRTHPDPIYSSIFNRMYPSWKVVQLLGDNNVSAIAKLIEILNKNSSAIEMYTEIEALLNSTIEIKYKNHPNYKKWCLESLHRRLN